MARALVGSTGFVGGNLLRQLAFDDLFHSRNIGGIRARRYDLVVCAAAPAAKWKANREPEADLANLRGLMSHLEAVECRRFVLVSTVDVFAEPVGVDEATAIDAEAASPYGRHRRLLEIFCQERFRAEVVRLPGLFGPGLRKNVIYDLLHDNCLDQIQPRSSFQFYDLSSLWQDVERAREGGLDLVHLATEPVTVAEVAAAAFGRSLPQRPELPVVRYDFRTRHAALWGRSGVYLQGREEVLRRIASFVRTEQGAPS